MVQQEDIDRRSAHAHTEPVVHVPDVYERPGGLKASIAPWMIFAAVGMIAAVALFAVLLSRGPGAVDTPRADAGGSVTTGQEPGFYRTRTVNVDRGIDVLALAFSPGSLIPYHGAPITADGVVVNQVLGPDAFTVTSSSGAEMLVYVAPEAEAGPVTVSTGQELAFRGTLMPVRPDFQFLVGPSAELAALSSGAYLYAVPETISVLTP